jgi:branched-chain amino acid transport system substrate-binding protein
MRSIALVSSFALYFACQTAPAPAPAREATPAAAPAPDLVLGEVVSLTGAEATFGFAARDGIELAARHVNAAGGIAGQKLVIKVQDSRSRPEEAATALARVLDRDKVVAVLGDIASTNTLAMAPIAEKRAVPLVTPASTAAKITAQGKHIFRACFRDDFQGRVMAIFASDDLRAQKAAILRDGKSDYSIGLAEEFKKAFTEFSGTVVAEETFMAGDVHFKAQLTKIREKKPDVLFVPAYYTEVGLILRQAKELGLTAKILGGDGWDSPRLIEIAGPAAEGTFFSTHFAKDSDIPATKRFVQSFSETFGYEPDGFAAMGFEAGTLVIDALKRAKTKDAAGLRDALAQTQKFEGLAGDVIIAEDREPRKPAFVLTVAEQKAKFRTRIYPR